MALSYSIYDEEDHVVQNLKTKKEQDEEHSYHYVTCLVAQFDESVGETIVTWQWEHPLLNRAVIILRNQIK